MRIFLIGPMGAGKSTVGRTLARILDLEFADCDTEIEHRTGADIPWIFEIEGEEGFRDREARVINDLTQRDRMVVATGGGASTASMGAGVTEDQFEVLPPSDFVVDTNNEPLSRFEHRLMLEARAAAKAVEPRTGAAL